MRLLTILFLLTSFLQVNAQSFNDITIKKDRASLETVFLEIEKQSEFRFFFNETLMKQAVPVTMDVKQVSLNKALEACFEMQPKLTYAIVEKTIIVKRREVRQTEVSMGGKDFTRLAELRGMVANDRGPVSAATVVVKGTSKVTTTNSSGEFLLYDVDDRAVLVVTHVSHEGQEIRLNGKGLINITLAERFGELDEQIVVAYNKSTKKSNVGAVSVVKGDQILSLPNRSVDKSLQGMVPGLLVNGSTGQPGGGVSNFVLRGIATSASPTHGSVARNPLIIIDGIPVTQEPVQLYIDAYTIPVNNPMSQLNPSDIETISVLKDAAAIALYGSRASNGVIVITTKKGKSGRTIFNFRHQTDFATRLKGKVELLNPTEYQALLYETYKNTPNTPDWTDATILEDLKSKFPTRPDGSLYPYTDWFNEIYNDYAATISNEISVSGGNDKINFYLNLEYTDQTGAEKGTGYDRKSLRFNIENRVTDWLKLGLNSAFSYNIQDYAGPLDGLSGGNPAFVYSPLNPVRQNDGNYILNYQYGGPFNIVFPNPVAANEYNININTSYRGLNRIYAELSFLKHFKLTSNVGVDFMLSESKEKFDPRFVDFNQPQGGKVEEQNVRRANIVTTNLLQFDKVFNEKHALNIVVGQEGQILTQKNLLLGVRNLGLPYYDQINSPGAILYKHTGFNSKETLLSFFGQANYGFNNKYLMTASIRRDGSSRFGEDKRFGTYWSLGTGWVVSGETFMKSTANWLSFLKFRGSIGAAGNAAGINRFTPYEILQSTTYLGGTAVYPVAQSPGNPDVKWEETFTWDAGIEARLFNERLSITADVYKRKTSNLIYEIKLPQTSGYQNVLINMGDMENKGVEVAVSMDIIRQRGFRWNINGHWSSNKNVLVKANTPEAVYVSNHLSNKEGENFNSFFLVEWAGVDPATGDPQWLDGEGNIVNSYPYGDENKKFIGKPQPDGFGAVTNTIAYKNFELMAMFYYQYGYQIYNDESLINDGYNPYLNQDKRALDRWQKPGDVVANPRRYVDNSNGSNASTRFLFDGDHIRLQQLRVTYNFPKKITDRLRLVSLRTFVQGHNLAIWTKYQGTDPGGVSIVGATGFTYPNPRSFSLGVNVIF